MKTLSYTILVKRQVMIMVYYEIKKVLSRTSSRIAIAFLGIILLWVCYFSVMNVRYINEKGESETGIAAVHKLKEARKEWSGELTEEKIAAVIAENNRINQTPQALSSDIRQQEIAYSWTQGYYDIRNMIINSFGTFREYDYYLIDSLKPEDASNFYDNRILRLQEWLDTEAKDMYSPKEKEFLLAQYRTLETPLYYDFIEGWMQMRDTSAAIVMITVLVLGFLVSGIFSRETQLKADSIFYSSYYGRNKAVHAKIKAGLLLVTVIYWMMMIISAAVVLGIIGWDGAGCPIQVGMGGWKSLYHLTFIQQYLLILFGGYIGTLVFSFLTMLVSARTRSAVVAVMTPFVLIFAPTFLTEISEPAITKIVGLFPDQMLQISQVTGMFNLYQIGGKIMGSIPVLFVLYSIVFIILYPVIYQIYKRVEVK